MNFTQTQVLKAQKRFATRYLLPLELCVHLQVLVLGITGMWPGTALHLVFDQVGGHASLIGSLIFMAGIAGVVVSGWEWVAGHHWENGQLRRILMTRKWLALAAAFIWGFALHTMLEAPHWVRMQEVMLQAPIMCFFATWSWWVNFRTHIVLDPKLKTDRLEKALEERRACW